ncbi:glycosyltransferase [Kaistella polysaccharea]|uniref:glycosyltransferase n=1 Tax=Kaistella polysaccharea TaxID=2878534 RepID=UPI001CF1D86A|nr:glycosyltransferase [Kaistella polysaccharea]
MAQLSILIVNYNNGHFFEDAYRSLLRQTSDQWEAVVIDDASTDNSVEVIQKLISGDNPFHFYQNEKTLGIQYAVMRAIAISSRGIFGRLDPDDALYPEAVEFSLRAHQNHPEVGLVYSDLTVCDQNLILQSEHRSVQIDQLDVKSLIFNREINSFATFKKKLNRGTSGIDPTLKRSEDVDVYMKMIEVAPVLHLPNPLYYYRIHNKNASKMDNEERSYFWHWVALLKTADRRNIDLENIFVEHVVDLSELIVYKKCVSYIKSLLRKKRVFSAIVGAAARFGINKHSILKS